MALYLLHKHLMQRYVHLDFLLVMGLSMLGDCQETIRVMCISRRDGKYFKGICPPKYSKEHKVGS